MIYMPDDSSKFESFFLNTFKQKSKSKFSVFMSPPYDVFVIAVDSDKIFFPESKIASTYMANGELCLAD